ncbi:cysteine-rich with EGF-like domain protein 2-B isoform X2 [Daktulosphaira vitifoliae]|uniref:cysteine-rich with EGF-like domain protein 2-B isoform X2 n=1 Tax=Daktulosphaira vitifoliae TaxID=58002 RepID=UPI0021AADCAB|nr:cysteine-rich with EGF-like domain protein 2-B isoform X2 [Daktulosphaira vitifoliae]
MNSILLLFLLPISFGLDFIPPPLHAPSNPEDHAPCKSCRTMVESFEKGLKKTQTGKYGGGNTAWEEENLQTYHRSELRFVEIHDTMCHEVIPGALQDNCFHLAEEYEHLLKVWFNKNNKPEDSDKKNLFNWLCINELKVCCETGYYGPECKPCKGLDISKSDESITICNNHGTCKGDGTRKGDGSCKCWKGYLGEFCNQCEVGFYEEKMENGSISCISCDKACGPSGCSGPGSKNCKDCNKGWVYLGEDHGCSDINECLEEQDITENGVKSVCASNEFCVNTDGSYSCLKCDPACRGCSGDGADMCHGCAEGYRYDSNEKKCIALVDKEKVNYLENEDKKLDEGRKLEL